jgi:hypothetical protein
MGKLKCEFKSPSGHLFESLTCGYSQSSMTAPELNPTGLLNPSRNPTLFHFLSAPQNASSKELRY